MRKVMLGIVIGALGVFAWHRLHQPLASGAASQPGSPDAQDAQDSQDALQDPATETVAESKFKCDGRIYCSQMTSCEEAEFFLENCPGVKMDGGGDGVPCERQWCGNH
jgi:hypothetical protein